MFIPFGRAEYPMNIEERQKREEKRHTFTYRSKNKIHIFACLHAHSYRGAHVFITKYARTHYIPGFKENKNGEGGCPHTPDYRLLMT